MIQLFAPLVTPYASDESVDLDAFVKNLQLYQSATLDGYVINGTSGEAEMLSYEERLELVRCARAHTDRKLIAGVVATSLQEAVNEVERLEGLQLTAVLVRTPSFYGGQLDQVDFFRCLADRSPVPVMVYQIPQCTGLKLKASQMGEIATHPNIFGIKDSLGDLAMLCEVEWPSRFQYFLGASALIQPGMAAGARGGILALANVVPELCRELLGLSADPARRIEARALQQRLIPLNRLLGGSAGFGIAGLKAACEMRGYHGGVPRRPLNRLTEAQRSELQKCLLDLENHA